MKPHRLRSCVATGLVALAAGLVALATGGCGNIFVPKHRVLVDAISATGATKPSGQSYRLVAKRVMVSQGAVHVPVVKACVDAALGGQGMVEAPPNVAPDIVIEVSFGRDNMSGGNSAVRETFLQLSARANPDRALDRATGEELWDVKAAVLGVSTPIETTMPLLASVAANYLATDTVVETKVEVPQNSPAVEEIRVAALRSLEGKPPLQASTAVGTPPPASASSQGGAGRPPSVRPGT